NQEGSIIDFKKKILGDQTNTSEIVLATQTERFQRNQVNILTSPISLTYLYFNDNSFDDFSRNDLVTVSTSIVF
ncbi:16857_t:CDS:1, partial [Cetraspora pellucida]